MSSADSKLDAQLRQVRLPDGLLDRLAALPLARDDDIDELLRDIANLVVNDGVFANRRSNHLVARACKRQQQIGEILARQKDRFTHDGSRFQYPPWQERQVAGYKSGTAPTYRKNRIEQTPNGQAPGGIFSLICA